MVRFIIAVLFVIMVTGCSSSKVIKTEKSEGVNFSSFKTFDFYKVEARGDTNSQKYNESIEKLENAIAIKMQEIGLFVKQD